MTLNISKDKPNRRFVSLGEKLEILETLCKKFNRNESATRANFIGRNGSKVK